MLNNSTLMSRLPNIFVRFPALCNSPGAHPWLQNAHTMNCHRTHFPSGAPSAAHAATQHCLRLRLDELPGGSHVAVLGLGRPHRHAQRVHPPQLSVHQEGAPATVDALQQFRIPLPCPVLREGGLGPSLSTGKMGPHQVWGRGGVWWRWWAQQVGPSSSMSMLRWSPRKPKGIRRLDQLVCIF